MAANFLIAHIQHSILALLLGVFTVSCDGKRPLQGEEGFHTVTINNRELRRDVAGEVVDAHDGCLQFFEGRYYLYGTAYGKSDGYGNTNRYRVYSSPDLESWTLEGELLKERPDGVYYRPYVVFNPKTRKYVLWYNWYPKLWNGQVGVATSDTPVGPFTIVNPKVSLSQTNSYSGDGSLFVDDDGTGYFIHTAIDEGYAVRVARLTPDYMGLTGETSNILAKGAEAPLLFRRNNLYYALCGNLCAFCPEGSGGQVFIANSPLGPYLTKRDWHFNRRTNDAPFIAAQATWVAKIPMAGEPAFIWMADRWGSTPDGIKGHDFQFWSMPLKFGSEGEILPMENVAQWHITWALAE